MTAVADLKAALGWHDQQSTLKTCQAIPAWVIAKIQIALAKTEALTANIVRLRMRLDELTAERGLLKSIQKTEADATDFLLQFAGIDQESVATEGGVINVGKLRIRLDELSELSDWRPIESAPKDELVLVPPTKRMGMCVAMNHSLGWVTETISEWSPINKPTHWRPLPPPPTADSDCGVDHGATYEA